MGLDCVPLGIAKKGYEVEWREIMETLYDEKSRSDDAIERYHEICIYPYELVGAPIVGTHPEADAWALERKPEDSDLSDEEFLQEVKNYYVFELVPDNCPGLSEYSNAGLYDGVDETSFRGQFLTDCEDLIGSKLLERAWTDFMRPEDAVRYGQALLDAAERASSNGNPGAETSESDVPLEEKLKILDSAGRWYKYWGERGHPIWANY